MDISELKNQIKVKFKKTGHIYAVIDKDIKMKDPSTGKWLLAVLYVNEEDSFVREQSDFLDKFELENYVEEAEIVEETKE